MELYNLANFYNLLECKIKIDHPNTGFMNRDREKSLQTVFGTLFLTCTIYYCYQTTVTFAILNICIQKSNITLKLLNEILE